MAPATGSMVARGLGVTRASSHGPSVGGRRGSGRCLSFRDGVPIGPIPRSRRPASQPIHEVGDAPRRPDPRQRRARAVGQPVAAGPPRRRGPDGAFPAILEMIPYRKDDWRARARPGPRRVAGGARLRPLPARRPGHGLVARDRHRRVHRPRDAGRLRRRRVAGGPAVVQRQRRDVGHHLRRLHLDPGREAPAAGTSRRSCR